MGRITSGVQAMKDDLDYCLRVATNCNTGKLDYEIAEFVYRRFGYLKPLSHKVKRVKTNWSSDIFVGRWLKEGDFAETAKTIHYIYTFFDAIREYGEQMKPLVREEISKEFSSLVDLTAKLKPFGNLDFKVSIPHTKINVCVLSDSVKIKRVEIDAVQVGTLDLFEIKFLKGEKKVWERRLDDLNVLPMIEDIMEHIVGLYRKVEDEVSKVTEHNRRIMRMMDDVIAHLVVAEEVHS